MCEIQTGYTKPNCAARGGIKSITLVNIQNVTIDAADITDGVVDDITSQTAPAYKISLDINSGFAGNIWTNDRANNSSFNAQTVQAMMKDALLSTDLLIEDIAGGYFLTVVTLRIGVNKVYGLNNGLFVTTAEYNSGTASGDMNGWTLNMTGEEDSTPPTISNTLLQELLDYTS